MNIPQLVFDFVEFVEKFAIISDNDGNVLPFDMKIRKFSLSTSTSRKLFRNFRRMEFRVRVGYRDYVTTLTLTINNSLASREKSTYRLDTIGFTYSFHEASLED